MANEARRCYSPARFVLEGDFKGSFAAVHVSPCTFKSCHDASLDCQSRSGDIV